MYFVLYRHYDKDDNLLYIGRTSSVGGRLSEHRHSSEWVLFLLDGGYTKYEQFDSLNELRQAEISAIKKEQPKFNTCHKKSGRSRDVVLAGYAARLSR